MAAWESLSISTAVSVMNRNIESAKLQRFFTTPKSEAFRFVGGEGPFRRVAKGYWDPKVHSIWREKVEITERATRKIH